MSFCRFSSLSPSISLLHTLCLVIIVMGGWVNVGGVSIIASELIKYRFRIYFRILWRQANQYLINVFFAIVYLQPFTKSWFTWATRRDDGRRSKLRQVQESIQCVCGHSIGDQVCGWRSEVLILPRIIITLLCHMIIKIRSQKV